MLLGRVSGHTYFSPLDFLRHDRARTKWGERNHRFSALHAAMQLPVYTYPQGADLLVYKITVIFIVIVI